MVQFILSRSCPGHYKHVAVHALFSIMQIEDSYSYWINFQNSMKVSEMQHDAVPSYCLSAADFLAMESFVSYIRYAIG